MTNTTNLPFRILSYLLVCFIGFYSLLTAQQAADSAIKEEKLDKIAGGASVESVNAAASADGQKLAWAEVRGEKQWVVVVNGQVSNTIYEQIGSIVLSPDGKRLAYAARRKTKLWVMVVDGQEQNQDLVYYGIQSPVFSPDGQRLAYAVENYSSIWRMVLDGKEGPSFKAEQLESGFLTLGTGVFSPDSRRFAYLGWENINGVIHYRSVFEDVVHVAGEGAGFPVFSPDSQHIAYCVKRGKKDWVVLIDGLPGEKYKEIICAPAYSPDGHMALLVLDNKGIAEVIDNRLVRVTETKGVLIWAFNLTLSPGGERLAYVMGNTNWAGGPGKRARIQVVLDGQLGKGYKAENISAPLFSPDGRHVAYVVHNVDIKLKQTVFKGKSVVVLDGAEGKLYWQIFDNTLRFTSENTLTYVARQANDFLRVTQKIPPDDADERHSSAPLIK